jgi:hypothetical protein
MLAMQKHVTFMSQSPPMRWRLNVNQSPPSSRSEVSYDSQSSIMSPAESVLQLHRQSTRSPYSQSPSPHSGSTIDLKHASISSVSSSMSMRDLGEAIGDSKGIRRKDSEMFYMIRNLKNDPFLGCKSDASFGIKHAAAPNTHTRPSF